MFTQIENTVLFVVAAIFLILFNSIIIRELSVILKFKKTSFLNAFDLSLWITALFFAIGLFKGWLKYIFIIAVLTFIFYLFMKYYDSNWKETLKIFLGWFASIVLLALLVNAINL